MKLRSQSNDSSVIHKAKLLEAFSERKHDIWAAAAAPRT